MPQGSAGILIGPEFGAFGESGGFGGSQRGILDPLDLAGERGREAALEAGRIQAEAAGRGIGEVRGAAGRARGLIDPFLAGGPEAFQQLQALTGVLGPEAQQQAMQTMQESPGQQFIRERSQRNLLRNQSAIGGLGGGNVRTALAEQGAGFAAQDIENQFQRLAGITGIGAGAAVQAAGFETTAGGNIAELFRAQGAGRASGVLGGAQAQAQGTQNAIGIASAVGSFFSDENMKEDIRDLGLKECYDAVMSMPLKSWKYLEETGLDQGVHFGPMAQAAPECIKVPGKEMLNIHDELMLISGALQYAKQNGLVVSHG